MNKYIAMRSDLRRKADLIIACENSINKGYADLDLTGVADPAQVIMDAIAELDSQRESDDVAIVVEFMGGMIDLGYKVMSLDDIENMIVYGNGVNFVGDVTNRVICFGKKTKVYDITVTNNRDYYTTWGIIAKSDCMLVNCNTSCKGAAVTIGDNCILVNCSGEGYDFDGITTGNNCKLINCIGRSNNARGIKAGISCTLIGCDGTDGGISVWQSGVQPNTQELLGAFNKGAITIQGD